MSTVALGICGLRRPKLCIFSSLAAITELLDNVECMYKNRTPVKRASCTMASLFTNAPNIPFPHNMAKISRVCFYPLPFPAVLLLLLLQSTLVISNSLISNNRLSRSENLVPVLTQRATKRQQNIVEKRRNCSLGAISPLFHNIFNMSLNLGVKLHIHSV